MLSARMLIERQKAAPSLVSLHRALTRLTSVVTVMNSGAHPDDEDSDMLALIRFQLGARVVIACSTRGEGGQNVLGPERQGALAVLRSREMEEAARVLDADIAWLGHGPADPVHDFGFSKDGDDTFRQWGEGRIVERLVRAYRAARPDIVIPTFLDVPGQHGHHRAMTRAAETALALAADPAAFPGHMAEGLTPWRVAKFYLPAISGAGDAYDDELPPPDATLVLRQEGRDPATGADYDRIGEWSRYYHASQGMGHWPEKADRAWPLHLFRGGDPAQPETGLFDGLPADLGALAQENGLTPQAAAALRAAQAGVETALTAFPRRAEIIAALGEAAGALAEACAGASEDFTRLHGHRLTRKVREIDAALIEAAGLVDRVHFAPATLTPGAAGRLVIDLSPEAAGAGVRIEPVLPEGLSASPEVSGNPERLSFRVEAGGDAPLTPLFLPGWSALGGNGHAHIRLFAEIGGRTAMATFDPEEGFAVEPAHSLRLEPDAFVLPLGGAKEHFAFSAALSGAQDSMTWSLPQGWQLETSPAGLALLPPAALPAGLVQLVPRIGGEPAWRVTPMRFSHVGALSFRQPERLQILSLDLKLPEGAKIGYIGGGADRVGLWLARMGLDVTELDAAALAGDLSGFTTLVVGIFAFGTRPDLAAATPRLHRFVQEGGHLVTLYHRPSDGWKPEDTPPRPITIGLPSLRWRVTDANAEVTVLAPDHPLLTGPNRIGPEDWQGWNKERGLYFAARWDECYEPLIAAHDRNEQPLKGGLLSARIGRGRHTHTSLVLHHQLDRLVPGAFRLMANLVQPA